MDAKKRAGKSAREAPTPASIEAAERRRLIAEAAQRRRAERLAEEAEADRRRASGEGQRAPRRYDEDDELPTSAGSSIDDDFLDG